MPNRIIRESIRRSETLAQLTGDEERLFWRLIVVADDYGRFDGRPEIIRAECFQAMLEKVSTGKVAGWLKVLAKVGLIMTYSVDTRPFIAVCKWDKYQDRRAKQSRWPDPSEADLRASASICEQVPANVPVSVSEERIRGTRNVSVSGDDGFDLFWSVFPNRVGKPDALKAWQKIGPDCLLTDLILAAVREQVRWPKWTKQGGEYIPYPATWLNRRGWEDERPNLPNVDEKTLRSVQGAQEWLRRDR